MSDTPSAPDDDLLWEVGDDGVAWLTLNRPDAANAITPDQRNRTIELLDAASSDLNVRVVVLTAAGERHFCTGADLRVSTIPVNPGPDDAPDKALGDVGRNIKRGAQRLISSILDCEKPVICAVNGTAAGIGAHIAFASDLVIAADNAKFIEVFVRRGITPDGGGAYLLPRIVGMQKAKELIFFGDDVRAADAERIGLVNKVVPQAELRAAAEEWATKLASSPTKAVSLSKWLLNRSLDSGRGQAFEDEAWAQEMASYTQDFQEGVAAFKERREVRYRGW
ncbi:MAG: enoyl-CoA hydratase/isomerase family protein [Acidimicrobiales bacterium]|jgi:2-(1,2-epoxy-1,2-dihydrophenyl)acetyl-CoA isomerase|nr:enoyl-CoA hydratase/isomerase family protein [Acidimicrobiales bacterium]